MVEKYNKRWPVIHDILKREGIAKQHLNSFDEFLENGLQQIITEVNQIDIELASSWAKTLSPTKSGTNNNDAENVRSQIFPNCMILR